MVQGAGGRVYARGREGRRTSTSCGIRVVSGGRLEEKIFSCERPGGSGSGDM